MCLGEGDGAVDGDVDLLATGHGDVLIQISEDHIKREPRRRGSKKWSCLPSCNNQIDS